jgi:hypothetical protein
MLAETRPAEMMAQWGKQNNARIGGEVTVVIHNSMFDFCLPFTL